MARADNDRTPVRYGRPVIVFHEYVGYSLGSYNEMTYPGASSLELRRKYHH